jgi:hypothetical protein
MDDSFGNHAINFNNLATARLVFDDTYVSTMSVDSKDCTDKLRARLQKTTKESKTSEESWHLDGMNKA